MPRGLPRTGADDSDRNDTGRSSADRSSADRNDTGRNDTGGNDADRNGADGNGADGNGAAADHAGAGGDRADGGTTPAIEARSVYRFFRAGDEETLALRGVSLRVRAGELVAVAGPSGSGKSTLLSCLAGLDEPDGGTVRVGGDRMTHRPEPVRARLRAGRIGMLTQSANLFGHLTVRANLAFVRSLVVRPVRRPVTELLGSLGLARRADSYPGELSGGELARAGLAMALANDPRVVLADEPTGELNRVAETDVVGLLRAERERGVAVVVASHSAPVLLAADRVVRLQDGRMVA